MKTKICKCCSEEFTGKSYNGCCCLWEGKLHKSKINAAYYAQNREIVLTEKYANMLEACVRQFGENRYFDAEILGQMKFDWKFYEKEILRDQTKFRVLKNYAYAVYKNQKIKIIHV